MKPSLSLPRVSWLAAGACALTGAVLFQAWGNVTRGYINTGSLFYWWGYQWLDARSETEHGLIIVPLAAWLLWRNLRDRPSAGSREPGSGWPGVGAMALGLLLHAVGFAAQQTRLSVVALLIFAWGVLRLGGGRRWGAAAVFPLAFLVFAIPFSALDSAGFWLRLWVIKASSGLAHLAGIGVVANGTQLTAPDGHYQYDVAAACSGVRSLVALLALALLAGYLQFRSTARRAALFLLCFPLIYLGNVARILAIILAAQAGGQRWGEHAHDVMGYGVFVIVLGGLLLAARWMPEPAPVAEVEDRSSEIGVRDLGQSAGGLHRVLLAAVVVGALAVGEMFFLAHLAALPPQGGAGVRLAADGLNPVELPAFLGTEWIGRRAEVSAVERDILPPDTGYSRRNYVDVANPAQWVYLSVVLSGRDRTSIHRPELCLVGQGWTIDATSGHTFARAGGLARDFPATVLHVRREVQTPRGPVVVPQLVVYWFVGGDTIVASHWRRLAVDAWNRVVHGRVDRWAYVLLQTDARDGDTAALARLQTVLDQTLPTLMPPVASGGR